MAKALFIQHFKGILTEHQNNVSFDEKNLRITRQA